MQLLRHNGIVVAATASLVVTLAYLFIGLTAAMPPDGGTIVYPLTWLYNYTALPASIVVVLAALTALFFWVPQAIVRGPAFRRDGAFVALALLAAVLFVGVALPLGRLIYRELSAQPADGLTYHLGVRVSADPAQNAYVLCECPSLVCTCRYLYDESLIDLDPLPTLSVAEGRARVQVEDRILYEAP